MRLKEDASEEKLNGRYFTPQNIAEYVTNWVLDQDGEIDSILEPSVGDGIFLECLNGHQEVLQNAELLAVEIDEAVSRSAVARNDILNWCDGWKNLGDNLKAVIHDDFYEVYRNLLVNKRYRAIVGNPPYIRYQYLEPAQREEQSSILTRNGMASNKLINAWVSFTVACVSCMQESSKIGFVIPAELLQVKYAEELRKFLASYLNRITIVTFRSLVFEGIEQEVVLLLGEKIARDNRHEIRIVQYDDVEEMQNANLDDYEFFEADTESTKWTRYFLLDEQLELVQLVEDDERFLKFSQVAKCEVGITTGNNDYFCINDETVRRYDLQRFCKPLIARSVNIKGAQFTNADWQENIRVGARTYLLDITPFDRRRFTKGLKDYIKYGEDNEQNTTYKCKIRDEWYKVPSVWSPQAFFLRRNYLYPKFMLNTDEVSAVSTDTMHRIRFNDGIDGKRAVVSYYTSVGLLFAELEGRSYGGGVLEILPGEVGNIRLPAIFDTELITDNEVEELFDTIDQFIRNNDDIIDLLEVTDQMILHGVLGFGAGQIETFRNAWLALRYRRLARGGRKE